MTAIEKVKKAYMKHRYIPFFAIGMDSPEWGLLRRVAREMGERYVGECLDTEARALALFDAAIIHEKEGTW
jgi:hypothetical protein